MAVGMTLNSRSEMRHRATNARWRFAMRVAFIGVNKLEAVILF